VVRRHTFGRLTTDSNVARPVSEKLPFDAGVCVDNPGVLLTKGVHAPREATHEWMFACGTSWKPCAQHSQEIKGSQRLAWCNSVS